MTTTDDLIAQERAGWDALSTSGDAAQAHYQDVLATNVLVVLPGGLMIDDRDEVVRSMSGAAWDAWEMGDERVVELGDGVGVLAYRGTARRGGQTYEASFTSTYVQERGTWKLAVHQQSPV
jgi:ketosteroid isomerase-like protein